MTDPVPSKEWGSPEQVKFVLGFVKENKRQGFEMCPLHVDFLLAVLEPAAPEPKPPHEREPPHCSKVGAVLVGGGYLDRMKDLTEDDTAEVVVQAFLKAVRPVLADRSAPEPEPTHYAFLIKRPRDKEAWPTIFASREGAEGYEHRASPVVAVCLAQPPGAGHT